MTSHANGSRQLSKLLTANPTVLFPIKKFLKH